MPLGEFELIDRFFTKKYLASSHLIQGIGDDAAIIAPMDKMNLVFTTDTLVKDTHFDSTTPPHALGHKLVAINLSDLAAMGATPQYALLALTLPSVDEAWLKEFSSGLFGLLSRYHVALIGGNTTQGPLNLNLQLIGSLPQNTATYRHGASIGDKIFVSGSLGKAGFALYLKKHFHEISLIEKFESALSSILSPKILLGQALASLATAAIDVSDGLLSDLNHLCVASHCGAILHLENIPFFNEWEGKMNFEEAIQFALAGGEDYELCFTLPAHLKPKLDEICKQLKEPCYEIGEIVQKNEITLYYKDEPFPWPATIGFQHFCTNVLSHGQKSAVRCANTPL